MMGQKQNKLEHTVGKDICQEEAQSEDDDGDEEEEEYVHWHTDDNDSDGENIYKSGQLTTRGAPKSGVTDKNEVKKRKRLSIGPIEWATAIDRHKEDIVTSIELGLNNARACNDVELQVMMLSLLPPYLIDHAKQPATQSTTTFATTTTTAASSAATTRQYLQNLCLWFSSSAEFECLRDSDLTPEEGRDGSSADVLLHFVLRNRAGSRTQLVQLFMAVLRALNIDARFVSTIEPCDFVPSAHEDLVLQAESRSTGTAIESRRRGRQSSNTISRSSTHCFTESAEGNSKSVMAAVVVVDSPVFTKRRRVKPSQINRSGASPSCWTEVRVISEEEEEEGEAVCGYRRIKNSPGSRGGIWIHCDPLLGVVDSPSTVESIIRKSLSSFHLKSSTAAAVAAATSFTSSARCTRPIQYALSFQIALHSAHCTQTRYAEKEEEEQDDKIHSEVRMVNNVTERYQYHHVPTTKAAKKAQTSVNAWLNELLEQNYNNRPCGICMADVKSAAHKGLITTNENRSASVAKSVLSSSQLQIGDLCSESSRDEHDSDDFKEEEDDDDDDEENEEKVNPVKPSRLKSINTASSVITAKEGYTNISTALPERFSDYKDHPLYALERHFSKGEALNPTVARKGIFPVAGYFKGEKVYRREHVMRVFSRQQWRRRMKHVPDNACPYAYRDRKDAVAVAAVMKAAAAAAAAATNVSSSAQVEVPKIELFGEWQTEPLHIPPVVDGILPVNKYGNIEVWDGKKSFVPAGATFIKASSLSSMTETAATTSTTSSSHMPYVSMKSLEEACTQLAVPFARAVVAFKRQYGSRHSSSSSTRVTAGGSSGSSSVDISPAQPVYGGVVVLNVDADMIEEAAAVIHAVDVEEEQRQKYLEICSRWEYIIRAALSRQRLRVKYGH